MADNVVLYAGNQGDPFSCSTDDIGGVHFPVSKILLGADGVNDGFVSSANPLPIGDAGGSITVDGSVAVSNFPAGFIVTNAGTFAVQATQSGTWATVPIAGTSGGSTPYKYVAAASANQDSQVVKASAGQVYSISGFSVRTTPLYLKLYNKATAPTSGDTPVQVYQLPSQGTANGSGFTIALPVALEFTAGVSFRITVGIADNDANAATAADCVVNLGYK